MKSVSFLKDSLKETVNSKWISSLFLRSLFSRSLLLLQLIILVNANVLPQMEMLRLQLPPQPQPQLQQQYMNILQHHLLNSIRYHLLDEFWDLTASFHNPKPKNEHCTYFISFEKLIFQYQPLKLNIWIFNLITPIKKPNCFHYSIHKYIPNMYKKLK